jgi:phospholipase D1/2
VRSAGPWSLGLENAEHSIHAAYLHLIDEANHFIYIENQFFMSNTAGSPVKNQIVQALVERIKIAASLHEPFKVIVMMPLLPGFEGKIQDSPLIKVQLHWEYSTISRGLTSLFEQLSQDPNIHNPEDYIHFVSLRNHAVLNNKPITEIVYVHSKLMIVDDDYVIIGSANINDRSLMGKRDSEIALVINDDNKVDSVLAGRKVKVSEFAHSLRMQLFKEFLGNGDEELLTDPLSDRFTSYWLTTAQNNTALYRHIFRCYPDDKIARLDQIDEYENQAELNEYYNLKDGFKGMLVLFPLNFLIEENLRISIFNKEYILPDENFV